MKNNFNEDYQYNSCTSRGICSINPKTSSLQEILILYLKQTAYYINKLGNEGLENSNVRTLVLDTISVMVSNVSFSENDFKTITQKFNKILPKIIKEYEEYCINKRIEPEYLKSPLKFNKTTDLVKSIQLGEKEFIKTLQSIPEEIRNMYKLLFIITKSICTNVQDLETYGVCANEGYATIINILNSANSDSKNTDKLKQLMDETVITNYNLMLKLRNVQIERYGKQKTTSVSYSTTPGKAILVVGSNIRELETILEATKDSNIDIYTHDEMIVAHTFPLFEKYKNLKGQFGKGIENCLLDFATFPGPIILTRHSLYNVENLYRGRLFTTDFTETKGIIQIKNNDFSEVIKSAIESKGFKNGKKCDSEKIGFDCEKITKEIKSKLEGNHYKQIFIIGHCGYRQEQQNYIEKLLSKTPENILIILLSTYSKKENIICLNACFDNLATTLITEKISKLTDLPLTIFFPTCNRHTISKMIYFTSENVAKVYVGECTPILINPNLMSTLKKIYGIEEISTVKNDLSKIIN